MLRFAIRFIWRSIVCFDNCFWIGLYATRQGPSRVENWFHDQLCDTILSSKMNGLIHSPVFIFIFQSFVMTRGNKTVPESFCNYGWHKIKEAKYAAEVARIWFVIRYKGPDHMKYLENVFVFIYTTELLVRYFVYKAVSHTDRQTDTRTLPTCYLRGGFSYMRVGGKYVLRGNM